MDKHPWTKAPIAARFRALRQQALLTQKRLAGLLGVSRQCVNEIENRRAMPHPTTWDRFCAFEARHNQPEIVLPRNWT